MYKRQLHTIVGAGSAEGAVDAANIIKPALGRGEIQVIGATTLNEYRKYIEKDAALERRFQPVQVGEPSQEASLEILKGLREKYEKHHNLQITDEALEAAVSLSARYINCLLYTSQQRLPDLLRQRPGLHQVAEDRSGRRQIHLSTQGVDDMHHQRLPVYPYPCDTDISVSAPAAFHDIAPLR